tara:strand:- start:203 stop:334 length:132 start_codon:yes stop_codon:yes gene_type:complete
MSKKVISFTLSEEAIQIIKKEAEKLDRSASWVVNNLIVNFNKK